MSTEQTSEQRHEESVWTDAAIIVLAIVFAFFIVFLLIGMVTHTGHHATIFHSWSDFYNWTINSNFAGLLLGLLVPTIPLATIATVHHRRTTARLKEHNDLLKEHHRLLKEIHERGAPPP